MNGSNQTRVIASQPPTLSDRFIRFLSHNGASDQSLRAHLSDLRRFLAFITNSLRSDELSAVSRLTHDDIARYIQDLLRENSKYVTVKRHMVTLRKFCGFLVRERFLSVSPVDGLSVGSTHEDFIPPAALGKILEFFVRRQSEGPPESALRYQRDELILLFVVLYGIRQYQLPLLKLSGINHTQEGITLQYRPSTEVVLDEVVVRLLGSYLTRRSSPARTLFVEGTSTEPVLLASLRNLWKEIGLLLGVTCNPKVLYHTHLHFSAQQEEGVRLREHLEDLHSGPFTEKRYL